MAIGALTTLFAGVWKFVGGDADATRDNLLGSLGALFNRIRDAGLN